MRSRLGSLAAFAALLALPRAAMADPLDVDLNRLGAPDASVWTEIAKAQADLCSARSAQSGGSPCTVTLTPDQAAQLAADSRMRFALLSSELALAMSSFILSPGKTTGHSGFELSLEAAYAPMHPQKIGTDTQLTNGVTWAARDQFPTHGPSPSAMYLPSFHVRKGLPFSFELGARTIYLNQTQMMAGQFEVKWALNEGFIFVPDLAVRSAVTRLVGQRDWDLTTADLDVMLSKQFGVMGVMNLTPYAALHMTWMNSQTGVIDFGPARIPADPANPNGTGTPNDVTRTQTLFPEMKMHDHYFQRYAFGVRMVTYVADLALEGMYFPGATVAAGDGYASYALKSSFYAGLKIGLEF